MYSNFRNLPLWCGFGRIIEGFGRKMPSHGRGNTDFNATVLLAVNDTISSILGTAVLSALHTHLTENYRVLPEEIPYRLDTLFGVLENVLGVPSAKTIGWAIARDVYSRIGLRFTARENFTLKDYLEIAKKELADKR